MEEFIASIVTLIILIPIVYFLPIGVTTKGKGILIVVAFIFAHIGLLSKQNYPLWQVALLLLLLSTLTVFIMDKRFGKHLYVDKKAAEKNPLNEIDFSSKNEFEWEEEMIKVDVVEKIAEEQASIQVLEKELLEEELPVIDKPLLVKANDEEQPDLGEEISFLNEREELLIDELTVEEQLDEEKPEQSLEEIDLHYMSDIEQLLAEETAAPNDLTVNEYEELDIDRVAEETLVDDWEELLAVDLNETAPEVLINDDSEITIEEDEQETLTLDEEEVLPLEEVALVSEEMVAAFEETSAATEEIHRELEFEQDTSFQQQLLHTMISQLVLVRKTMESFEYEALIKEHMHPDLTALDYYSFASLLIEHYISQKEIEKLSQLIIDLKERYVEYPILEQEIQYLHEQYCEKAR